MSIIHVERQGGLANFGGMGGKLKSRGQVDQAALSDTQREEIDLLFRVKDKRKKLITDGMSYKITRTSASGSESVVAPEAEVPSFLVQCVKDEIV